MKSNTERAVLLIAALSLLLGLSLGQIHQQHKQIQKLETQAQQSSFKVQIPKEFPTTHRHPVFNCQQQNNPYHQHFRQCKDRIIQDRFLRNQPVQSLETTLLDLEELSKEMIILEKELEKLENIQEIKIRVRK